jgi:two-component system nitrogen regulation response regulator NtrX
VPRHWCVVAGHVLLIDDNPEGLYALTEALRSRLLGVSVEPVATGEEGLRRLLQQEYDVVVCDVLLPGISGLEVLDAARKRYPHVSVIVITAGEFQTEERAMGAGAFAFVPKPLDLSALVKLIRLGVERTTLLRDTWRRRA